MQAIGSAKSFRGAVKTSSAATIHTSTFGDQLPYVHRVHARRADGLQAEIGVLVGAAKFRLHANAPCGFKKYIRRRLLVFHHLTGHHGGEEMPDFQLFEHQGDDLFRAVRAATEKSKKLGQG